MKAAALFVISCLVSIGLIALTGYGTSLPVASDTVDPTVDLISPLGGEEWYIGDTHDVLWSATDTHPAPNGIHLWYSLNGGTDYLSLAEGIANDGSEPWTMPAAQSDHVRVRVRALDSFGNFSQVSSGLFSITYVPPAMPQGVTVDISNNIDAVITWQAVTQTIYGSPIVPDGYIVLYNESPYEYDEHFYYFLTETSLLTATHYRVARFRDTMFYRVLAYKDYTGRLAEILAPAKNDPTLKLSLAEIKAGLRGTQGGGK